MGSENFIKWHRQHCQEWNYSEDTSCLSCNGIAYLDNQLEGLDHPAYFEDHHYNNCWLKNCVYCKGFMNIVYRVEEENNRMKAQDNHTYAHVMDQPDGSRVEACQAVECRATIKKRQYKGRLTKKVCEPVPWWSY